MMPLLFPKDGDPAGLAAIHAASFADSWSANSIGDLLATPGAFAFYSKGGFVAARAAGGEAEILTIAVRPSHRRKGEGAALVGAAADHARLLGAGVIFLEVAAGNDAARELYAGLGFVVAGRRKGYYAVGQAKLEDALVLRSNLPLSPLGKRPVAG